MQRLIEQALVNNRDLRVAAANIAATRAQYRIQRASLLPNVSANGRYSYTDRGSGGAASNAIGGGGTGISNGGTGTGNGGTGNGGVGNGGIDNGGAGGVVTGANGSGSAWSVNLGVNAFELDLFGRIRSLTGAALDRYFATEAAARATRLTLVGDIAEAWLNYGADQSLLAIARDTAASAQRSVTLTRARLEGGIAPRTDLRQPNRCWRPRRPIWRNRRRRWRRTSTRCNCWSARRSIPRCCQSRSTRPARPSPPYPPGWIQASCCGGPMWCRPNMSCAPPMPRSARHARRCSRASR